MTAIRLVPLLAALWASAQPLASADEMKLPEIRLSLRSAESAGVSVLATFDIEPGWHLYWKNPGDSGLPPKIHWELPAGWIAAEPLWPAPEVREDAGSVTFVHEGSLTLVYRFTAGRPDDGEAQLRALASWVACKDICVSGRSEAAITMVPEGGLWRQKQGAPQSAARLEADPFPSLPAEGWDLEAQDRGRHILLSVRAPEGERPEVVQRARFIADASAMVEPASSLAQPKAHEGVYTFEMIKADGAEAPDRLEGVLVSSDGFRSISGRRALQVDVRVKRELGTADPSTRREP